MSYNQKYRSGDQVIVKPYGFTATVVCSYFDMEGDGRRDSYRLSYCTPDDPYPHILEWYPEDMLEYASMQKAECPIYDYVPIEDFT